MSLNDYLWIVWPILLLCLVASVIGYTPTERHVLLLEIDGSSVYTPMGRSALLLETEDSGDVAANTTTITGCTSVSLNHSLNLSCQFNATSTENFISWSINDSRVDIVGNNNTAYVVDNPTLAEYNMNGCWILLITANASNSSDTETMTYCIDDSAPSFNETLQNATFNNIANFSWIGNWSDLEFDTASATVNCTAVNVSINNSTRTYNVSRIGSSFVGNVTCVINLNDTVKNRNSNEFVYNFQADPSTVAVYSVTNGSNLSALRAALNLSLGTYNFSYIRITNASNVTNNYTYNTWTKYNISTENVTATNPFFRISNNDTQLLHVYCSINQTFGDINILASPQFSAANATNLTTTPRLIYGNVSPNITINITPYFHYTRYNFTAERNDSAILACTMEVS